MATPQINPVLIAAQSNSRISSQGQGGTLAPVLTEEATRNLAQDILKLSSEGSSQLKGIAKKQAGLETKAQESRTAGAVASSVVLNQAAKAKLETQQEIRSIHKEASKSDLLMNLNKDQTAATERYRVQQDEYITKRNASIGEDGFLGWLTANLTMASSKAEADAAAQEVATITQQISGVQIASTATATTIQTAEEIHTDATIAALDAGALAAMKVANMESQMKVLANNGKAIADSFTMTREGINTAFSAQKLANETRNSERESGSFNLKKATNAEITRQVNLFREAQAMPLLTEEEVLAQRTLGGKPSEEITTQAYAGMSAQRVIEQTEGSISGALPMGDNYADAVEVYNDQFETKAAEPSKINKYMGRVDFAAVQSLAAANIDPSKATNEQRKAATNAAALAQDKRERENITVGSVFEAPPLAVLFKNHAIANSKLGKLLTAAQQVETNPQEIFDLATTYVRNGKMKQEEAISDMSDMFKYAAHLNNISELYERFNIKPQTSYSVILEGSPRSEPLTDFIDESQLRKSMNRQLASTAGSVLNALNLGPSAIARKLSKMEILKQEQEQERQDAIRRGAK